PIAWALLGACPVGLALSARSAWPAAAQPALHGILDAGTLTVTLVLVLAAALHFVLTRDEEMATVAVAVLGAGLVGFLHWLTTATLDDAGARTRATWLVGQVLVSLVVLAAMAALASERS